VKKRISILVLCLFIISIFAGTAVAKNDNGNHYGKLFMYQQVQMNKNQIKIKIKHFIDVDNDWAQGDIDEAVLKGFISGYGDGKFQPKKPVTCLEAIVMVVRAAGLEDTVKEYELSDEERELLSDIPDWAQAYMAVALEAGLLDENELDSFNPNQGAKRHEVCTYMNRILEGYGISDLTDTGTIDYITLKDNLADYIDDAQEILDDIEDELDAANIDIDEIDELIDLFDELEDEVDDVNDIDDIEDLSLHLYQIRGILDDAVDEVKDLEDIADELIDEVDNLDDLDDVKDFIEDILDALDEVDAIMDDIKDELDGVEDLGDFTDGFMKDFIDEDLIPSRARIAVRMMNHNGVVFGNDDGSFNPMRVVKRNEMAAMLNRLDTNCLGLYGNSTTTGTLLDIDENDGIYEITIIDNSDDEREFITDEDTRIYYDGELLDSIDDVEYGGNIKLITDEDENVLLVRIDLPADE